MMRMKVLLMVVFCVVFAFALSKPLDAASRNMVWTHADRGLDERDLHVIAVDSTGVPVIFVSSRTSVYKSEDRGVSWKRIVSFKSTGGTIHTLAADPGKSELYICTGDGLYVSKYDGTFLKKIYGALSEPGSEVLSVLISSHHEGTIFIGTGDGLFRSDNGGKDWERLRDIPIGTVVYSITEAQRGDQNIIFAYAGSWIYRSPDRGRRWEQVYDTGMTEWGSLAIEDLEAEDGKVLVYSSNQRNLLMSASGEHLYATASKGLLHSDDYGETWAFTSMLGFESYNIGHMELLSPEPGGVLAATERGVFRYIPDLNSWEKLYKGISAAVVRYVKAVPAGDRAGYEFWAAASDGLYKLVPLPVPVPLSSHDKVLDRFSHEPTIEEVRRATIRYADVGPGKIRRWHKAAARKAWLPDVRIGYDSGRDWQTSDYFYSTSKEKYVDDDITEGSDSGWSVSLSWDLSELVWNSDQTSIDSRSRYMVQLRDDLLNTVTRIYFERRRVQIDMVISPPADIRERLEKEVRLEELTASIDALTGSYFSRAISREGKVHTY